MQYAFILGAHPKLSAAEIKAVLPQASVVSQTDAFLILETVSFKPQAMQNRLGGTIKIAEVLEGGITKETIISELKKVEVSGKLKFGVSYYHCQPDTLGMEVKGELKKLGLSIRLVTGRDKALSSVIVTKNKVHEFLVLENKYLARTSAVQDFEKYSTRDYGRPERDMKSGSLPPKLAKMMINLSGADISQTLLDPFCGSGTVLQEALLFGFTSVIGTDKSQKAVDDTNKNLEWLLANDKSRVATTYKVFQSDVSTLSAQLGSASVDVIVTEPYLGPPLRELPDRKTLAATVDELTVLYQTAFTEFSRVLRPGGTVVFIFPSFKVGSAVLAPQLDEAIKKLRFTQVNDQQLLYGRTGQRVFRDIKIFRFL